MGGAGREGQEGGVCVYIQLIRVVVQQKLTHFKAIILQLKQKKKTYTVWYEHRMLTSMTDRIHKLTFTNLFPLTRS